MLKENRSFKFIKGILSLYNEIIRLLIDKNHKGN